MEEMILKKQGNIKPCIFKKIKVTFRNQKVVIKINSMDMLNRLGKIR